MTEEDLLQAIRRQRENHLTLLGLYDQLTDVLPEERNAMIKALTRSQAQIQNLIRQLLNRLLSPGLEAEIKVERVTAQ